MKIKLFRNAIGFSFWHYFGKPHGTAIQCRKIKSRLFGMKLVNEFGGYHSLDFGFWWTWNIQLLAIHENQFKEKEA